MKRNLTSQERAYKSESEDNFRWLSSFLATRSPRVLTAADKVDEETHKQISATGQYAEIAHGSISPSFVFSHLEELCSPGNPLEDYHALHSDKARFVSHFKGDIAEVQGYVTFRQTTRQLLIAFSGTSSPAQAFRDLKTWRTTYPLDPKQSTVHAGFWEMYTGIQSHAYDALRLGFQEHHGEVDCVVLTGHSMGSTLCYLLALDLMARVETEDSIIKKGTAINLTVFGSPRLGNDALARYWRKSVDEYVNRGYNFTEYLVKGYNDGVTALPPLSLGFRHLTESPLYFQHGILYRIPPLEKEHGLFVVERQPLPGNSQEADLWPRGGHNYYNDRDMEKLQRRMKWLNLNIHGEQGWQNRYAEQSKAWEMKWGEDSEG